MKRRQHFFDLINLICNNYTKQTRTLAKYQRDMKTGLLLTIIFFFVVNFSGKAQFVSFGQDPAHIRWKQIQTEDFQIIYPDFFETDAQKVANIYAQLYHHANTLHLTPRKISIILHADGGVSNGNVALAPRKSELYTMPSQEPSDTWLEHLCTHEFRHVVQLDKVNQGLTRSLYYIFGEIFPIAVTGIYVPMWFIEGDATCFETAVGNLGRGRSPEFLNEMKAQVTEKGIYSFYKAILGSYKDFVPNRYTMGYYMTANSRANYGPDIWADALKRTGRRPFGFKPFAKSLQLTLQSKRDSLWSDSTFRSLFIHPDSVRKANTYKDAKRTLYHDNFTELQQIWKKEAAEIRDRFDTIYTHNKYYGNYYYPTPAGNGQLLAYKKGLQQTGAFVLLKNGEEKIVTRTGVLDDYKFALNQNKMVWAEYKPNPRWEQGGRMVLSSYGLHKKKYKRHRAEHNRFAPFPVDENWGCVEVNHQNHASIVILDAELKEELWRITAGEDELFIHPSYHNGKITTVVQTTQGLHFESIDPKTRCREKMSENVFYELDNPVQLDSMLFFRASFNGNNSFYRKDLRNGETVNILNAPFGLNFPAFNVKKDSLYFSFYTSNGYKPAGVKLSELQERPVEVKQFRLADTLKKQEDWKLKFAMDSVYHTRKYNKLTHLINIHSWGPINVSLNDFSVDVGLVVYSQNKLSTLDLTAGYVLKSGFDHGAWILNASYKGWWPIIGVNFESGREDFYSSNQQAINIVTQETESLYVYNRSRRSSADVTVRLPFNISVKNYNRSLQPYFRYKVEGLHHSRIRETYRYNIQENTVHISAVNKNNYQLANTPAIYYQLLEYGLTYNNQTRMTDQEVNPRWGQLIEIGFTQSPLKQLNLDYQWWADSRFYFPGFCLNHSFTLYTGFQTMSEKERNFSNKILNPRGISLYGYEISALRTAYHLPLLYPDQHISSILYIKSVDGGVFYDRGKSKNLWQEQMFQSYGLELTANTHIFRLTYPIHIGFRTGYETQHKKMFTDLIFSIGLSI